MRRVATAPTQHDSALRMARSAGIREGSVVNAQLVVGVTPAAKQGDQILHFCSGILTDPILDRIGFGPLVPEKDFNVFTLGGFPEVTEAGLILLRTKIVCRKSGLSFEHRTEKARFVPYLPSYEPNTVVAYARSGGALDQAYRYGCGNVQEMFQQYGQPIYIAL